MAEEKETAMGNTPHSTLCHLLDEQARASPANQAFYCADGNLTYQELSLQSRLWAKHIQERTFGLAGSVLPIYMPSSSLWAIVAMFAVLRTEAAFAFIDSSVPDSEERLEFLVSTANASCVLLGPAEHDTPSLRSIAPCAVCLGSYLEPTANSYDMMEVPKRPIDFNKNTFHPAWALLESTTATVTLLQHSTVINSIVRLRKVEETIHEASSGTKSKGSQPRLVLWPFIVRHDTLLHVFGTIAQGGHVLAFTEDATPEDIRSSLCQSSQDRSRICIPSHRLSDVLQCSGEVFLYDIQALRGSLRKCDANPIYVSYDMGYGKFMVASILSNGNFRIIGASDDVSVVETDNVELQTAIGAIGELSISDRSTPASCTILYGSSPPSQKQYSLPLTDGIFLTGMSACVQPDGSIHILNQIDDTEPTFCKEGIPLNLNKGNVAQGRKALGHMHRESAQNPIFGRMGLLRGIWASVLGIDQTILEPNDRFLDCGGDSLKATQLISLARVKNIVLPVPELFTSNLSLQEMATSSLDTETQGRLNRVCESDRDVDLYEGNGNQLDNDSATTLLEQLHLPGWINPSHIDKFIPATGWQASLAGHSTLKAQHWADCWVMNFYGPLSLDRLQISCASLLETHEILRSIFVVGNGHAYQLVVKASHYPMDFTLHHVRLDVGETLDSVTRNLWTDTKNALPELDRQWIRFMVIRQNLNHHRLVVRLTHAQYDAGSIPTVLEHLRVSYQAISCRQQSVPKSPSLPQFSSFVAWASRKEYVQAAEAFWKTMLDGSKPTHLRNPPRDGPLAAVTGLDHVINERISSPEMTLDLQYLRGIMPSTVISAAWSAVLMFLTGESDVVCGIITSGRHNSMPGIDQIVGPCWNMLPVRIKRQGSAQTIHGLLEQVQRNQQTTLAHELLSFRHIVEKCTGWSPWAQLCSIINFENVAIPRAGGIRQSLSPDTEFDFAPLPGPVSGPTDFWVAVTPYSRSAHTSVTLELRFDNRRISRNYAGAVMRVFSELILSFTKDPEARITDAISHAVTNLDNEANRLRKSIIGRVELIRAVLSSIWNDVLGCSLLLNGSSRLVPYYNIHSEVIFATAIAQCIRRKLSVDISTEVVMRNPSLDMLEDWLIHNMKLEL